MKYGVIKNLISEDLRNQMIDRMDLFKDHAMYMKEEDDTKGLKRPAYYGLFNSIQLHILPEVEKYFKVELLPTYNYSRIYQNGSTLLRHTDRKACECSITVNLYQENGSWPIWMEYDNNRSEINLEPGDAAWYKGCEVLHWREENTKGKIYQTFMHYVDKNGKYSDRIYDENPKRWFNELNHPMYQFDF